MRVLVTGGAGFIGSHLVDALIRRGDQVTVLDDLSSGHREYVNPAARFLRGDVLDRALTSALIRDAELCFHLAATPEVCLSVEDWSGTHRINQTGTISVFEAVTRRPGGPVPVIYASSAAVYGIPAIRRPLRESDFAEPVSAYGADKRGSELHGRVAWHVHQIPNTGLRFFNVYGPRQKLASRFPGVIAAFSQRIAVGDPITVYGDGLQVRDFIYVGDVVEFLLSAARTQNASCRVFNACSGTAINIFDLASAVGAAMARRPVLQFQPPRAGDIDFSVGDLSSAKATFGHGASTSLMDGLLQTVQCDSMYIRKVAA